MSAKPESAQVAGQFEIFEIGSLAVSGYNEGTDPNTLAKKIVDETVSEEEVSAKIRAARKAERKGGRARANALTPARRSQIARIAAEAHWRKQRRKKDQN